MIILCLFPRLMPNPKYRPSKKNGGSPPPLLNPEVAMVPVGCNECMECRKQKANGWRVRLNEELKSNTKTPYFVTWTFTDNTFKDLSIGIRTEGWRREEEVYKKMVKKWREAWRKSKLSKMQYWMANELGGEGTERMHAHGIVWTDENPLNIAMRWRYQWNGKMRLAGMVDVDIERPVTLRAINYIVKYITKIDEKHPHFKSRILNSPGIGNNYINTKAAKLNKYGDNTDESYILSNGHKVALPIYYRNKIYTEEEREALWVEKIKEDTRFVDGVKIKNASKNEDKYFRVRHEKRKKNKMMGYKNKTEFDADYERTLKRMKGR